MVCLHASLRSLAACLALCVLSACHATARTANAAEAGSGTCNEGIPELFKRVSPAVVMITGQSINPYRLQGRVTRVLGSGFVIDANGLILTNSHVVFGLQSLTVTLDDGAIVPAKLVGADPIFDLAVIQIKKTHGVPLPTAKLGNSDNLRPGEEVIAIGNPLGLDQTVTRGIVSGYRNENSRRFIQSDVSILPGSSGGPLLEKSGRVVGIAVSGRAQGLARINFFVPIGEALDTLGLKLTD